MDVLANPHRGRGLPVTDDLVVGQLIADPSGVQALLQRCPAAAATPLLEVPELARRFGIGALYLKDERDRMGLGSFKALGAAHAIARMAAERADRPGAPATDEQLAAALEGVVFACASAGNHGLSLAAGAPIFGAQAVVYLSDTVPEPFAARLRDRGATVVRSGHDYEASMVAAAADADANGWVLLSDSTWPGYVAPALRVMEGYLAIAAEVTEELVPPPSHVLVQAGVGGLAAAMAALLRDRWGDGFTLVVVEPTAAPALAESIRAGRPVNTGGPASSMGRLDCKEPSHVALAELARTADAFVTLEDAEVEATADLLRSHDLATTPSGAAGVAAVQHADAHRGALGLDGQSRVLAILTEGPE